MTAQRSAVLYDPVRTAIGTFGGCLKDMPAASSYHWVGTRCLPQTRCPMRPLSRKTKGIPCSFSR
jgi:hypothetical protein